MAIFSLFLAAFYRGMTTFMGQTSRRLSERLVLQMEARRGLMTLFAQLQEGVEVVSPVPGTTLPYLVYKDILSNFVCIYLEPDSIHSKEEEKPLFRAMLLKRDPGNPVPEEPKLLVERVAKLNFTTHSPSGVLLSLSLCGGKGEFSLINFVRLKNSVSED